MFHFPDDILHSPSVIVRTVWAYNGGWRMKNVIWKMKMLRNVRLISYERKISGKGEPLPDGDFGK